MALQIERRRCYNGPLPYDAEIEYLESVGADTWIDTEILPVDGCLLEYSAAYAEYNTNVISSHNTKQQGSANGHNRLYGNFVNSNVMIFAKCDFYKQINVYQNAGYKQMGANTFFDISFDTRGTAYKVKVNGFDLSDEENDQHLAPLNPILCFWDHYNNICTSGKIKFLRITDKDNRLVRDFIPVRKGTGGFLYDKVTKRLFGNKGAGHFVLGNDLGGGKSVMLLLPSVYERRAA